MHADLMELCACEAENYFNLMLRNGWPRDSRFKVEAEAAWDAVRWFAEHAPPWVRQPLLLSPEHLLDVDDTGWPIIVQSWPDYMHVRFSASLWCRRHRYWDHPDFETYGSGVMAHPHAPKALRTDPQMLKLLPPRVLFGLDKSLCWRPLR
jgi:hypothetical protein